MDISPTSISEEKCTCFPPDWHNCFTGTMFSLSVPIQCGDMYLSLSYSCSQTAMQSLLFSTHTMGTMFSLSLSSYSVGTYIFLRPVKPVMPFLSFFSNTVETLFFFCPHTILGHVSLSYHCSLTAIQSLFLFYI